MSVGNEIDLPVSGGGSGGSATWGSITGTLANQTDLENALNAKAPTASPTFTGTITTPLTAHGAVISNSSSQLSTVAPGTSGNVLTSNGTDWVSQAPASGSGTVTSVGLSLTSLSWLSISGSPVTTSGTLALSAASGLTANQVLATPNGSSGAVGLRALVAADIPALSSLSGSLNISQINATGTASSTTYLRGDGSWSTPSGSSGANTALSNLASTAVNTDILSASNNTNNIGLSTLQYNTVWGFALGSIANNTTYSLNRASLYHSASYVGSCQGYYSVSGPQGNSNVWQTIGFSDVNGYDSGLYQPQQSNANRGFVLGFAGAQYSTLMIGFDLISNNPDCQFNTVTMGGASGISNPNFVWRIDGAGGIGGSRTSSRPSYVYAKSEINAPLLAQVPQYVTASSNFTVAANTSNVIVNYSGTITSMTITMPASPTDGALVRISFGNGTTVTSLTVSPNTSQTVNASPSSAAANSSFLWQYSATAATWFRYQ